MTTDDRNPLDVHLDVRTLVSAARPLRVVDALHAVLDIHQPEILPLGQRWIGGPYSSARCVGCAAGDNYDHTPWPCATIEAIIAATNGEL